MVFAFYFLCNPYIMDTMRTRQKLYPSTELKLNSGRDATRLDPSGFPRSIPSAHAPRDAFVPDSPEGEAVLVLIRS